MFINNSQPKILHLICDTPIVPTNTLRRWPLKCFTFQQKKPSSLDNRVDNQRSISHIKSLLMLRPAPHLTSDMHLPQYTQLGVLLERRLHVARRDPLVQAVVIGK